MIHHRFLIASLLVAAVDLLHNLPQAGAAEHVWARTNYGASNINRPYSTPNNGYGGYYVPRNAYGNNYEGRQFTNPDGFIIPAQQPNNAGQWQPRRWRRR